jgi:hypothetical protein
MPNILPFALQKTSFPRQSSIVRDKHFVRAFAATCTPANRETDVRRRGRSTTGRRLPLRPEFRIYRRMMPTPLRWYCSREAELPRTGTRRLTRAFWNWPKRVTFQSVGHAELGCVIAVRAVWSRERLSTDQGRLTKQLEEIFLFVARSRAVISSSICKTPKIGPEMKN